MSSINFENVTKVYDGDIVAVEDFNLTIQSGEFLTLVGPSGSGKSTLLRMVAGLEDISGGTIAIGDEVVNMLPPRHRDIAMVFQSYALYPHLSVRENMAFGLKRSTDLPDEAIYDRVEDAAELMGIPELLDDRPKQLSGGQQQRVATGRAIVREPAVFLFDEPLSNLDAKLRKHMRTELQRIQKELDTTTIYVTHDQEEAMTMSDRIAILNHGELQQVGTPREVYNDPHNLFVAQFIGSPSMNIFDVTYEATDNGGRLTGDINIPIDAERAQQIEAVGATDLKLGIRPEHVNVSRTSGEDHVNAYIDIIEPLGARDLLYFTLESETDDDSLVSGDAAALEDEASPEGEVAERKAFIDPESISADAHEVYLDLSLEQADLFDANTGANIEHVVREEQEEPPTA
ncbi:ABC transporter ATP-binding protein [Natronolimnobius baerhuensis]|uniref:ABC-type D-xylose/L-arabinose transporter n=1 Tax=Natronolimnobius baerhuensis TaxID=253108 RepID=A0A202E9E0_9EURY|nr:sn-glycerol-3-phosphate ABC transporter ATP-binding protein UgpC [Natronolimnobius baerhuensis]OVE84881.1 sugar ABC transporter ATP-binding protein [Natronolimnobius baerhuensis]